MDDLAWDLMMVLVMYDHGISSLEVPAGALGSTASYDGRALNQKKTGCLGNKFMMLIVELHCPKHNVVLQ